MTQYYSIAPLPGTDHRPAVQASPAPPVLGDIFEDIGSFAADIRDIKLSSARIEAYLPVLTTALYVAAGVLALHAIVIVTRR